MKKGKCSNKWQKQNLHEHVLQDCETSESRENMKTNEKGFFTRIELKLISSTTNHSKA